MTQINFMNYEVFQLDLAQTELSVVKEAITCLLHTIAFHRAYGPTLPVTVECDFLDVAYVRCRNTELNDLISRKATEFLRRLSQPGITKGQLSCSFTQKIERKAFFRTETTTQCWEQWQISVSVDTSSSGSEGFMRDRRARTAANLYSLMGTIVNIVDKKHSHIPGVPNQNEVTFMPEINVVEPREAGASGSSWGGFIRGIMTE